MFEVYRGQRLARGEPIPAAHPPFEDSMLEIDFAELSDTGRVRAENEDCLGHVAPDTSEQARSHGWLFAVADGVEDMPRAKWRREPRSPRGRKDFARRAGADR